jgi:hypothetical protein
MYCRFVETQFTDIGTVILPYSSTTCTNCTTPKFSMTRTNYNSDILVSVYWACERARGTTHDSVPEEVFIES